MHEEGFVALAEVGADDHWAACFAALVSR
jgi:hypothetical protein